MKKIVIVFFLLCLIITLSACTASTSLDAAPTYSQIQSMTNQQLENIIDTRLDYVFWRNQLIPDYIKNGTIITMCQDELNKREIINAIHDNILQNDNTKGVIYGQ